MIDDMVIQRSDLLDNVRRLLARCPHRAERESRIVAQLVDAWTSEADVRAALRHLERSGELSRSETSGRQSRARRTIYKQTTKAAA